MKPYFLKLTRSTGRTTLVNLAMVLTIREFHRSAIGEGHLDTNTRVTMADGIEFDVVEVLAQIEPVL